MNVLSKWAGAAVLAASLGIAAAPAQAQGFGFQINPPGSNFSFGFNVGRPNAPDLRGRGRCISQRSIDDAIEAQGYDRVRISDYGRRTTEARGSRGNWLYALVADTCTGRVIDRDRIRRI